MNPEPEPVTINIGSSSKSHTKTYKESVVQNPPSPSNFSLEVFKTIQEFLLKVHADKIQIPGLYIGVQAYFNQKYICQKTNPLCQFSSKNCPCKVKFLFRKARIDLELFKAIPFGDVLINTKCLLDYGCLESILIPPTDRFKDFDPSINEAINHIQAEMMSHLAIKIVTCPSNFTPKSYPTHVLKIYMEDHIDYPILYNDGFENWVIQGNTHYQYSLMRAQIQGYHWFFSSQDERKFNLLKETFDTKLYIPCSEGNWFIPFPMELNNKLVQFFQKEKRNKEIYEEVGCYGQQTHTDSVVPSTDFTMEDTSSDLLDTARNQIDGSLEEEDVLVSRSSSRS